MRSAKTIFIKQAKDLAKNPMILVQFILFPIVALVMTELIAKSDDFMGMPVNMFVTMMGAVFTGMGITMSTAGIIAEDIEKKSLRFLVMAGVKPSQYLAGTGGFLFVLCVITSFAFGLIGVFTTAELLKFTMALIASSAVSIVLGATIGIISKNQQSATSLGMPVAMVCGFIPMIAAFNKPIYNATQFLYTLQLDIITTDFDANFAKVMTVIGLNFLVMLILFTLAYRKRGLRS